MSVGLIGQILTPGRRRDTRTRTYVKMDANAYNRSRAPLTPENMCSFTPAKIFREAASGKGDTFINSVTFDDAGKVCVTAGEDDYFTVWDVEGGKRTRYFQSQKYGVDHVTSTHHSGEILHGSTKINDDVRMHSAHDNKYLRYFKGHKGRVISIEMHPLNTVFLTGSEDQTVMMWDTRTAEAKGLLKDLQGPAITAWESTGLVFAVGLPNDGAVCLYSYTSFDRKPFKWATIDDPLLDAESTPRRNPLITSLSFSNDGKLILVGTSGDTHYVLDGMDLFIVARLKGHKGLERDRVTGAREVKPRRGLSGQEVRWTPDSRYIMSGSHDGQICVWDLKPPDGYTSWPNPAEIQPGLDGRRQPTPTLTPMRMLNENKLGGMSRVVMFNPRYNMFVSGGESVVMWLPSKASKGGNGDEEDMQIDS